MRLAPAVLTALIASLLLVLVPAGASAAWFAGDTIDGPSGDIDSLGGVDLARDGTGGVVYLRRDGGESHVYLSRIVDGAFRTPERVDAGLPGGATAATVAAGDGAQLVVGFVTGGSLYGSFAPGGGRAQPLAAPQLLAGGSPGAPVTDPHVDLGINRTAYLVFGGNGNVGAFRLRNSVWEPLPAALDVDPAQAAGVGASRPRVAVSAEGNAVAVWGEEAADGRRRVYGRRLTGLVPSAAPREVSVPELPGVGAGGPADTPDVDVEDDGSYAWVTFRQDIAGGSRTLARRLIGSQFEGVFPIDAGQPSTAPRFDMSGRGIGATVTAGPSGSVIGGLLDATDVLLGFGRTDSAGSEGPSAPAVAVSERRTVAIVYRSELGGVSRVLGRQKGDDDKQTGRPVVPFDPESLLSPPELGPVVGAPEVSGDNNGDFTAAFLQGPPAARRLVVSVWDKPPGIPVGRSTDRYQHRRQPLLRWGAGKELWGAQQFKVFVDDVEVATTGRLEQLVPAPLPDGPHSWRVVAIDRRGQAVSSKARLLRIDTATPRVRVRVTGRRRARQALRIGVTADDGQGSGIGAVTVDYGDRTAVSKLLRSTHRYRRGTFSLKVRVSDRAGNVARRTLRLRIGR